MAIHDRGRRRATIVAPRAASTTMCVAMLLSSTWGFRCASSFRSPPPPPVGRCARPFAVRRAAANDATNEPGGRRRRGPKNRGGETRRRFAQEVHPPPPPPSPRRQQQQQQSSETMDEGMARTLRAEADKWDRRQRSSKSDDVVTVKDVMDRMAREEGGGGGGGNKRRGGGGGGGPNKRSTNRDAVVGDPNDTNFGAATTTRRGGKRNYGNGNNSNDRRGPNAELGDGRGGGGGGSNESANKSMMRANMSIDDLENIMMKRWGTSARPWTEDEEGEEEEERGGDKGKRRGRGRGDDDDGFFFRAKAVADPWDREDGAHPSSRSRRKPRFAAAADYDDDVEDFYDEDDEGYEIDLDDDDDAGYGTILSPRPVAGSGRRRESDDHDDNDDNSSVFGRRRRADPVVEEERPRTKKSSKKDAKKTSKTKTSNAAAVTADEETTTTTTKTTAPKKPKKPRVPALLDAVTGEPVRLDLDKALRDGAARGGEEPEDVAPPPTFESLGITHPLLLANLEEAGFTTALPVQAAAIPAAAVEGRDVLLPTHTGSGKTLAFLLPIAQRLLSDNDDDEPRRRGGVRAIVLAPGRELASQIASVARELLRGTSSRVLLAIGGTPFGRTATALRKDKPDVVVATPGRLAELVLGRQGDKGGKLKLNALSALVLDEFDALTEYEPHREPTKAVLDFVKRSVRTPDRPPLQTFLCSATAKDVPADTWEDYFSSSLPPVVAAVDDDDARSSSTSGMSRTIAHGVVHVPHKRLAVDALRRVLHTDPSPEQILVFVATPRRVDEVVEALARVGVIAAPLRGGPGDDKEDRAGVNRALREGRVGLVVATELAARGLDAPYLTHVVNLDLPTDASHYAHRAGRCGRGPGRPGVVLSMTTSARERRVPRNRFGNALGVTMYTVEPREGTLVILDESDERRPSENDDSDSDSDSDNTP